MRLLLVPIAFGSALACGDNGSVGDDVDGGDSVDAGVDAPVDAPEPESLAAMCGGAEPQTLAE